LRVEFFLHFVNFVKIFENVVRSEIFIPKRKGRRVPIPHA